MTQRIPIRALVGNWLASRVAFNPAGSDLLATNVQDALIELSEGDALPEGGESAQVLTSQSGGTSFWFGNAAILLDVGEAVPVDTPVGTLVFRKAA